MQPAAGQHVRELDISRVCPHKLHYRVACDLRSEHGVQLLEVFRAFTALHPDVELSLTVRAGSRADHVLGSATPDGLEVPPLLEDELLVALPADHRLTAGKRVHLRDLAGESWIDGSHPDRLGPVSHLAAALGAHHRSAICATTGTAD